MKILYTFPILPIIVCVLASAPNMVSYTYDYAGNRMSCRVVLLSSSPNHIKKDTTSVIPVAEKLGDRTIVIYPSPTKGALAFDISDGESKDQIHISLFSIQGV